MAGRPGEGVEAVLLRGERGPYRLADYMELPEDGPRFQLMQGWLVREPSPNELHQRIVGNLYALLRGWVRQNGLGAVYLAPFDTVLSDQDVIQPDLLFIAAGHRGRITPKNIQGAPDLVVEVLSPGTSRRDRVVKLKICAEAGVREAWLVDSSKEALEVIDLQAGSTDAGGAGAWKSRRFQPGERIRSEVLGDPDFDVVEVFAGN